jgi:hypothetical protein
MCTHKSLHGPRRWWLRSKRGPDAHIFGFLLDFAHILTQSSRIAGNMGRLHPNDLFVHNRPRAKIVVQLRREDDRRRDIACCETFLCAQLGDLLWADFVDFHRGIGRPAACRGAGIINPIEFLLH